MTSESLGWATEDLRFSPRECLGIEHVKILQMLVTRVTTKQVEFVTQDGHSVCVSSHGDHSGNLWLDPSHRIKVENVNVVEALIAIVAAKHIQFASYSTHRVARPS